MRYQYKSDPTIDPLDPLVEVRASEASGAVPDILAYLARYQRTQPVIIPVKTTERLVMVKTATIILADIQATTLLLHTTTGVIETHEPLRHLQERLKNPDFVQVSKHGVLNLDHLLSLEDSFSGNMTATLTNQVKTNVSRKYVKQLMQQLGV